MAVLAVIKLLNFPVFFCKFPDFPREKSNHDLTAVQIPAMSRLKAQALHIVKNDRWTNKRRLLDVKAGG